jgi:2C-methyl-D-erythritol 2,4-cyclodiphosphate synthase
MVILMLMYLYTLYAMRLGAAGLRDIGYYFPNTDDKYKNADSKTC